MTSKLTKGIMKTLPDSFHFPLTPGFVSGSYVIGVEVPGFNIGFINIQIRRQNGSVAQEAS